MEGVNAVVVVIAAAVCIESGKSARKRLKVAKIRRTNGSQKSCCFK